MLEFIPENLITQELCNEAIQSSVRSIRSIPEKFVTKEMLIGIAKRYPAFVTKNFPDRLRTKEFLAQLTNKYPTTCRYIKQMLSHEQ